MKLENSLKKENSVKDQNQLPPVIATTLHDVRCAVSGLNGIGDELKRINDESKSILEKITATPDPIGSFILQKKIKRKFGQGR